MSGTEFLSREEAVVAHLFWAMLAVEQVSVMISGRAVSGTLLAPDSEAHAVVFSPTPGQSLPDRVLKKGKIVLVKYASLDDEYQFKSQILQVDAVKWLLAIPRDIRRNDRRMIERSLVYASRRHTVSVLKSDGRHRVLLVHDLSPAGIGITYDSQIDRFKEGQVLRGTLNLPGHDDLDIRFEVVTICVFSGDASHCLMGCRFVGLGFSGCEKVATALDGSG
jgi:hypothetical protein